MKLILILAGPYASCMNTQNIWSKKCHQHSIELEVMNLEHTEGQDLTRQLHLKSFPALVLDSKVIAVGHPDINAAEKIIAKLI